MADDNEHLWIELHDLEERVRRVEEDRHEAIGATKAQTRRKDLLWKITTTTISIVSTVGFVLSDLHVI